MVVNGPRTVGMYIKIPFVDSIKLVVTEKQTNKETDGQTDKYFVKIAAKSYILC